MKTNELRIGNWIYTSKGNPFPMQVVSIGADHVYLEFPDNQGDAWEPEMKEICGIPFTEELLLKCGFKKQDSEYEKGHPDYYEWLERKLPILGWVYQCDTKEYLVVEINDAELHTHYLHQLQNLYFDLTGEELIVNL